jgi:hypothetical protein
MGKKICFWGIIWLLLTGCQINEVEPQLFDDYFLNENTQRYSIENFAGNYAINEDWFTVANNNESKDTKLYFGQDNGVYSLDIPLFSTDDDKRFSIRATKISLAHFRFDIVPSAWAYTNKTGQIAVAGSGVLNQTNRTIHVEVKYYFLNYNASIDNLSSLTPRWDKKFVLNYID